MLSSPAEARTVRHLIDSESHADYVYMYPPRQAYRPFSPEVLQRLPQLVRHSLDHSDILNLYVHVPFCRQICSFCNLYTVRDGRADLDRYVDLVLREARWYAALTDRKQVASLYLGGGTPSILAPSQLERLVSELLALFSVAPGEVPAETALEVDPASVDVAKLRKICDAGVNRINLGYQSFIPTEVATLGRVRAERSGTRLLEEALSVGFANVCVDLIYGLEHQTDESWRTSVREVARIGPETICAYPLTLRPHTGYGRRGYDHVNGAMLRARYAMAHEILTDSGYRQETHVRWVRDGGGYRQKANHWALQNILGFGAGARSYLWDLDFRNGYSVRHRQAVLESYGRQMEAGRLPADSGFLMTDDERRRKMVALNIQSLDRTRFREMFGTDPFEEFPDELAALTGAGVVASDADRIWVPNRWLGDRDLFSQLFFSADVRRKLEEFTYDE
ncbi:oxygen-independent coproporphyrinogen-3 oxidase [Catenuloplanes nepalensis]|uniref:Heme chaperone HemW n=1 Tax=Catenuloplanes nepalensis TaxID=587533 RepID=A0ABT9MRX1_9ACTN|nr:radical SAM protein [Catenuloplanes nepalensis]MDP9794170.1 oxygen-independent coproporphyrinogen-3 oxidase [Catenuloplanes nepalensis]